MTPQHREPILIPCEGSGGTVHDVGVPGGGMCQMCGQVVQSDEWLAVGHERQDIIAMLKRGDFG